MSAFAVSLLVLASCGLVIVGAALVRMYGAERRRVRRQVSPSASVSDAESATRRSRS